MDGTTRGSWVVAYRDDPLARLPVVDGAFQGQVPATTTELAAEDDGWAPGPSQPPGGGLALSLDEVKAAVLGLRPRTAHLLLLGLIAVAVVSSFQAVGALLVFGLLVGPPATAALLVRRVPLMMIVSVLLGVLAVYFGLLLSFHFDLAGGATISGLSVVGFFVVMIVRRAAQWLRHEPADTEVRSPRSSPVG